jgi:hypothetical protein
MKMISNAQLPVSVSEVVPGFWVGNRLVTRVEQGYVYASNQTEEIFLGIIPHVLSDVNRMRHSHGTTEWEIGDRFMFDGKHRLEVLDITDQMLCFQIDNKRKVKVMDIREFRGYLKGNRLEPLPGAKINPGFEL